jgi:nicotinamidase-related amidase
MRTIDRRRSTLLVIDIQGRLMPAIADGGEVVAQAGRLMAAADLVGVPVVMTEQNPRGLGPTVQDLKPETRAVHGKMHFDACREAGFLAALGERPDVVVAGCEAHVCVAQTVLGLVEADRKVYLVRDAIGARRPESKETAIRRLAAHGAEIVTTEMVIFEWLETAEHPRFKEALGLVR